MRFVDRLGQHDDFVSAVRFNWPVKVLVFNNSELGFVKMETEVAGLPLNTVATHLQDAPPRRPKGEADGKLFRAVSGARSEQRAEVCARRQ